MFHDLPHGVLRFGQDQPKRPDRMDFSETVENDPFVNAGKERGGVGLGRGAIAKDDDLQFAEALRGYVGLWKVLVFSRKPQEAKFFFLCEEVFLKFLYLRLSSRAMQMAEVMIEPWRWRASPKTVDTATGFGRKLRRSKNQRASTTTKRKVDGWNMARRISQSCWLDG